MKRRFTILTAALALLAFLALPMGMMGQTTVTFTAGTDTGETSVTKDGITVSMSTMSRTDNYRCYANSNMTIESTVGNITNVELTCTGSGNANYGPGKFSLTEGYTGTYSYSGYIGTWTGSAEEISLTASAQVRMTEIVVTVGGSAPTSFTVTYDANGGTGTMTDENSPYEAGALVTVMDNVFTRDNYIFEKWNTSSDGLGIDYDEGDQFEINANTTLYAQWTEQSSSDDHWVLTDLADLTSTDVFVIVGNNGSDYAMSNGVSTTTPPSAISVTVNGIEITSTVAANIQWNISGDATNGYTFYPNGDSENWLYCTASNNGVRVGTNTAKTFKMEASSGYLVHQGTSRYIGLYTASGASVPQDWRCYTSINNNIKDQTFAFYKKVSGTVPPSIAAQDVSLDYDAEEGTISYTISNPVEGGVLTAEVTEGYEWISADEDNHTEATGTVGLITDANTATTARTATVTLTYTYDSRETVTKTVTVTQAAAPVTYTTIPDLFAAATTTETNVLVTFNNWVVSGVSSNGKNVFVTDNNGNGFVIYYTTDMSSTFAAGDILSGTAVSCTLKKYNGFAELLNVTATDLTITSGGTVTVADVALANLAGVNTGALLHYDNLTCEVTTNSGGTTTYYNLTDGTTSIQVYTSIYDFGTLEDGKTYNITGVYQQYNNYKEILPRSAEDIKEVILVEPTITVTPDVENGDWYAVTLDFSVTYENIEGEFIAEIVQVAADGETPATYYWFEPDTYYGENDGFSEDYTTAYVYVQYNEGAERTGYFKIYVVTDDGEYYSNLVTITQEAYAGPVYGLYTYSVNGEEGEDYDYTVGESIELDGSDDLIAGFTFVGWTLDPNDVDHVMEAGYEYTFEEEYTVFYAVYEKSNATRTNGNFVKVTSTEELEDGTYLIVFEADGVAFNGGLETLDAIGNIIAVTITDNTIASSDNINAATFTIAAKDEGYSIKSASGMYIGNTSDVNALKTSENDDYTNTISINSEGDANIVSSNSYLRYNFASNQLRFRYYKSSSYTNQQPIQLYKQESGSSATQGRYTRVFIEETVDSDITIVGPSIIPSGNTLTMDSYTLTNNLGADRFVIEDGAQLVYYNTVSGTMQKNINACDYDENNNAGYYLFTTPIDGFVPSATNGFLTTNYDLYTYNAAEDLEWRNYKAESFNLAFGKGYMYANGENTTLQFAGTLNATGMCIQNLAYVENESLKSLNLVGNPYTWSETFCLGENGTTMGEAPETSFLSMNSEGDGFIVTTATTFEAQPLQGFFVQATAENQLIMETGAALEPELDDFKAGLGNLNIKIDHNNNLVDNAIVSFGNVGMLKKFYLSDNSTRVYIPQGNQDYAVVRSTNQGEMPVSFKAKNNGTYTLSVNAENVEMEYLHLIDNMTGADVDLLATPSYSFEAKTTDYATRFRLVFSANNENASTSSETFAFFNGSSWTISNLGEATLQVVDVMGRIVSSQTISGNAEVNVNEASGVYMFRLINGNDVKTQKVVVR